MSTIEPKFIQLRQASRKYGVPPGVLKRLVKDGQLSAKKLGVQKPDAKKDTRRIYLITAEVDELLKGAN